MKYDDASWHYGGNFPEDLPREAGATHIAMYVAWAVLNGLAGSMHIDEFPEMLGRLRQRELTPGACFISACDEKFTDEDLNEEGNAFSTSYFSDPIRTTESNALYLSDYDTAFPEIEELYAEPDTWDSYARLRPILDRRFEEWKSPKPKGWRKFFQ